MRKITILLFTILPFLGFAQTFDFTGVDGGWTGVQSTLIQNATSVTITFEADSDPKLRHAAANVTDPVNNGIIGITLKNNSTANEFRFVFENLQSGGNAGVVLPISSNDTAFQTYYIDLSADDRWDNVGAGGTQNAIDFAFREPGGTSGNNSVDNAGSIEIDQIIFVNAIPRPEQLIYNFNVDGDNEGWSSLADATTTISGGTMTVTPADPGNAIAKVTNGVNSVDADANSHMYLVYKNLSADNNQIRIQFRSEVDNYTAYSGTNVTVAQNMESFATLIIDLEAAKPEEWSLIAQDIQIAIRNTNNGGNVSSAGDFIIDQIGFMTIDNYSIADGSWNDETIWSNGTPLTSHDVIIATQVAINGDEVANDVTVLPGANLFINKNKSLSLTGKLVTDSASNNSVVLRSDSDQFSSLIVDGSVTGEIRYRRYVNTNASVGGNDLIASPVGISSFNDFYSDNNSYFVEDPNSDAVLFGPFDNSGNPGVYINYDFSSTEPLIPGKGYRMGTNATLASDSGLNFHGTVTTGNVDILISSEVGTYGSWNLIGNPYPSYIKLSDFLAANNALFSTLNSGVYGYDGDASDGWTVWNQAYSDENPGALITPGQGFFVASNSTGGTVSFTPSMRSIGLSDDFIVGRNSNEMSSGKLSLNLTSSTGTSKTEIYFNPNATEGLDPGYDSGCFGGNAPSFSIYSRLVDNSLNQDFAVQSLSLESIDEAIVPIGIKAMQGQQLTISLSELNLPDGTEVYLDDTDSNTSTLLTASDYVFTPNANLNGVGRFYLRFTNSTLSTNEEQLEGFKVFSPKGSREIIISGHLDKGSKIDVYDINGRQLISRTLISDSEKETLNGVQFAGGFYVITITKGSQKVNYKVVIQ